MASAQHQRAVADTEVRRSQAMQQTLAAIHRIAQSDLAVLIVGEHGTGKEWAARTIHRLSSRAAQPFRPFDCAAVPPDETDRMLFGTHRLTASGVSLEHGIIEEAEAGTLMLSEFDALPPPVQMKVARIAEYGQVHREGDEFPHRTNVRLICTLSRDPEPLVSAGKIRREMYYAISTLLIHLPSLRERREDIPDLIDQYLLEIRQQHSRPVSGISESALRLCLQYHWPGNLRNLRNAMEHASVMSNGGIIQPEHLPHYLHSPASRPGA